MLLTLESRKEIFKGAKNYLCSLGAARSVGDASRRLIATKAWDVDVDGWRGCGGGRGGGLHLSARLQSLLSIAHISRRLLHRLHPPNVPSHTA